MARVVVARLAARCCGLAGIVGALFTAIYIFRLVFLVFFGERRRRHAARHHLRRRWKVHLPLIVLAVLSIVGGWVELPPLLGDQPRFTRFLDAVFAEHGAARRAEHARRVATPSTPERAHDQR